MKDIHFKFIGFHGSEGLCHLRIINENKTSPMIIVCSQYKNYYGTSVTNAFEIIVETLIYAIENGKVKDVNFSKPVPTYREWHRDISIFDKLLTFFFREKYESRFAYTKIKIKDVFDNLIWIENYPTDYSQYMHSRLCSVVNMNDDSRGHWIGTPSNEWLLSKGNYTLEELLPPDDILDLHKIRSNFGETNVSITQLRQSQTPHRIRWTRMLTLQMPGMLCTAKAQRGLEDEDDMQELPIQHELERFFAVNLPARELLKREVPFKNIVHLTGLEDRRLDFCIFKANGSIDSALEVKRANAQTSDIINDVIRLLIISKLRHANCYLLIYGNENDFTSLFNRTKKFLAKNNQFPQEPVQFTDFSLAKNNYKNILNVLHIPTGFSLLQGLEKYQESVVGLWQISHTKEHLGTHKPYSYYIYDAD